MRNIYLISAMILLVIVSGSYDKGDAQPNNNNNNNYTRSTIYQGALASLDNNLVTQDEIEVSNNVNKLKQYIGDMGVNASFKELDARLSSIRLAITKGDLISAKKDIDIIKKDISIMAEASSNIADANKIIEDTSKLRFYWAESPDTNLSKTKLDDAKKFLAKGDYKKVIDLKKDAVNLAYEERKSFWAGVKSNPLLYSLYSISNFISGDPEKYEPKNTERLILIWTSKPYMNINKSAVNTNSLGNGITYEESEPQKNPIYFELDPGNPTKCGIACEETTATLTNTGDQIAHNVKVNLDIYNNDGDKIYSTQESLGDIPGGQSISKTEKISPDCGFLYTKCTHSPFTLRAGVTYEEGIQKFQDQQFNG